MDRGVDGAQLFDVSVAVRILCGEELRGARFDDASRPNSGSHAHVEGVVYGRKIPEQSGFARVDGAGADARGRGDAMVASGIAADFFGGTVVAVLADFPARHVCCRQS